MKRNKFSRKQYKLYLDAYQLYGERKRQRRINRERVKQATHKARSLSYATYHHLKTIDRHHANSNNDKHNSDKHNNEKHNNEKNMEKNMDKGNDYSSGEYKSKVKTDTSNAKTSNGR